MGDTKPVASAGNGSTGAATDANKNKEPPKDPPPPQKDEGFLPSRFEFNGGAAYPIADSFQFRTEAGYLIKPWIYTGIGYMGNFTGKNSAFGAVGFRWNINEVLSIQPTLIGGVGGLSDYSTSVGPLKEEVILNGVYGYINPEVRFLIEPPNVAGVGFYVAPGFMAEFRGGANAMPMNLISGEDTAPNSYAPTISFGLTFGTKPKKQPPKREEYIPPPPPVTPPESKPEPKKDLNEEELQKRIEETKQNLIKGRKEEEAKRIAKSIDEVRTNINNLKKKVVQINDGINRTNKVGRVLEETFDKLDNLPKNKSLSADEKKALETQLDTLLTALELSGSFQPVSTTQESESIRKGLRLIYLNKRYGERFQKQLERLKKGLTEHKEKDLAAKADSTLKRLNTYLDQYPDATKLEDLNQDVTAIQGSIQTMETVEKEYNLSTNPDWILLKQDLDATRTIVTKMNRELNALRDFSNIFTGNSTNMGDQVDTPERAQKTLETAQKFIKDMPTSDKYSGVTLETLRDRYTDYFGFLSYSLDHFISRHVPPDEKRAAERRKWFDSVKLAKDLLCKANPQHARCGMELEEPPKATKTKTPVVTPTSPPVVPPPPTNPPPPPPPPSKGKPPPPPPPPEGIK